MFEPTTTWSNLDLVNLSCKLGQIMTRYDFQEAGVNFDQLVRWIGAHNGYTWLSRGYKSNFGNVRTDSNLT